MKKNSCRNNLLLTYRELQIKRLELMQAFITEEPEKWYPLDVNPDYMVSNHGRLMSLKSYGGRKKVLCPSLKYQAYLYYTITENGQRRGISVSKLLKSAVRDFIS